MRWNHPERGLVAPGVFISYAEECGLIGELGRQVLEAAAGKPYGSGKAMNLLVSVNLATSVCRAPPAGRHGQHPGSSRLRCPE